MSGLSGKQVEFLLRPLKRDRVHRDPGGNSYLPQQDVRAHLTRVFGFGGWSMDVVESVLIFDEPTRTLDRTTKQPKPDRFDACYRATVRLSIRDPQGQHVADYTDSATGDAQNQTHLAAHDLALKSAVSTALKRAATCLGDQFGLSLYNKGSLEAFVVGSLVAPDGQQAVEQAPAATEEERPEEPSEDQQAAEQRQPEVPPLRQAQTRAWRAACNAYPNATDDQRRAETIAVMAGLDTDPARATTDQWEQTADILEGTVHAGPDPS